MAEHGPLGFRVECLQRCAKSLLFRPFESRWNVSQRLLNVRSDIMLAQDHNGDHEETGVTALVTTAILPNGARSTVSTSASLKHLESFVQTDGGICTRNPTCDNLETSLAVLCLSEVNSDGRYSDILRKVAAFVKTSQWNETRVIRKMMNC